MAVIQKPPHLGLQMFTIHPIPNHPPGQFSQHWRGRFCIITGHNLLRVTKPFLMQDLMIATLDDY